MMEIDGYMVRVQWDGSTLRVRPRNKMARVALFGPNQEATDVRDVAKTPDELVLPREEITDISFRDANPFVNGNLVIHATDGRKYQLHFRRKHRQDFARLADALKATAAA